MQFQYANLLLNPQFEFWDYGTSFTSTGYTASRWYLTKSGGTPATITVSKGILDNSSNTPYWYRGSPSLQIDISNLGSSTSTSIRQLIEHGTKFTSEFISLRLIVFGPEGATFQCGFNNELRTVTTLGNNPETNVPIPTFYEFNHVFNSTSDYLSCDIFKNPTMVGTYSFAIAQLSIIKPGTIIPSWEFRNPAIERLLLNRYIYPVQYGQLGITTTDKYFTSIKFPTNMRTIPTYHKLVDSIDVIENTTGTIVTAPSTTHIASNITASGARLELQGFSGLTSSGSYMLGTDGIGYFTADY